MAAAETKIAQMPEQINIPNSDNGQITTIFQIANLNKWILSNADCHPLDPVSGEILLKINGSHFIIFVLHLTSALTRIELHSRILENLKIYETEQILIKRETVKCPALLGCCFVHMLMILTKESPRELSQFYFRTNIHKNSLCVECAVPAR